jgi:transcriptional regulator with PAS, ATPase and Fis domain
VDELLARRLLPTILEDDANADLEPMDLAKAVGRTERRAILRALARSGDNKAEAASLLGIGERTLWTKLKKHDI